MARDLKKPYKSICYVFLGLLMEQAGRFFEVGFCG